MLGNNRVEKEIKYRNELKYEISGAQMWLVRNRIKHLLKHDTNVGNNGKYSIRSLYFDDLLNRCFYENENGTDPREKYRIRIYNHSIEQIKLECKRKECGMTYKESCFLTVEQARLLMAGKTIPNIECQPLLLRKFMIQMLLHHMQPVVIVEYDRVPYVYKTGNVRITFDLNIASSKSIGKFLEEAIPKRPIMPAGHQLLEVKYDEILPDFIYNNLQLENLRQTAFSKYYMCRKFSM